MSVPEASGSAVQHLEVPQKTITELLTQWADLTNDAIAATGETEGWKDDTPLAQSEPWDPAAEKVSLPPCSSVGAAKAHQVSATVFHAAFEDDPHPIADKLTAHWKGQGFTVVRTVDWASQSGRVDVAIRATRSDGVFYGLGVTSEIVAIDVTTQCSAHPSIQSWAREKSLRTPDSPAPSSPSFPTADPGVNAAGTDDRFWGF
jgi:hypothetical protein